MDTLRFAIGDDDELNIEVIRNILQANGHTIAAEERDGPSLLRKVRSLIPDFVIVSTNMPGMKGTEIARIVGGDRIAPVLVVAEGPLDMYAKDVSSENFAFIMKPISDMQLMGTIEFVYNNYKRIANLENEVSELKVMLETRKMVEKAKGILMDAYGMKEKDAFRYIQKRSMDECKPVIDIAKRIIENIGKKK